MGEQGEACLRMLRTVISSMQIRHCVLIVVYRYLCWTCWQGSLSAGFLIQILVPQDSFDLWPRTPATGECGLLHVCAHEIPGYRIVGFGMSGCLCNIVSKIVLEPWGVEADAQPMQGVAAVVHCFSAVAGNCCFCLCGGTPLAAESLFRTKVCVVRGLLPSCLGRCTPCAFFGRHILGA